MERKFETFDQFRHECEIESIDCVTRKVVVGIPEEGGIRDHKCWQTSVPERGVVAQTRFRQNSSIERKKKRFDG
jgi:spore germination protein YaaH